MMNLWSYVTHTEIYYISNTLCISKREIESEVDPKIIVVGNCQGLRRGIGPLEVPNGVLVQRM